MDFKALFLEARRGGAKRFADALQRVFPGRRVVCKDKIKIDREALHVTYEEVDRRAAFERECIVRQHTRRDPREKLRSIEIDAVHGFSTRTPSVDFNTHGWSLPVGSSAGLSFAAHGAVLEDFGSRDRDMRSFTRLTNWRAPPALRF